MRLRPTYPSIPRVHRVPRRLTDGRTRHHFYHRPTRIRLPPPDSPEFQPAYDAAEKQWSAEQQAAQEPSEALPEQPKNDPPAEVQLCPVAAPNTPKLVTRISQAPEPRPAPTATGDHRKNSSELPFTSPRRQRSANFQPSCALRMSPRAMDLRRAIGRSAPPRGNIPGARQPSGPGGGWLFDRELFERGGAACRAGSACHGEGIPTRNDLLGRFERHGRRYRRSLKTADRAAAERRLGQWIEQLEGVAFGEKPPRTFVEAAELFIKEHLTRLKPSSANRYGLSLKSLAEHFGPLALSNIKRAELSAFET